MIGQIRTGFRIGRVLSLVTLMGCDAGTDNVSTEGTVDTGSVETEADTSSDSQPGVDTGSEVEAVDTSVVDTGGLVDGCPAEMVPLSDAVCMDRYEASRPDATDVSTGSDESRAVSRVGVLPWYVNPMSAAALSTFDTACQAAGKRLCSAVEWENACRGPQETTYFFGNTWDPSICNSVDTYCQTCCDVLGIDNCPLSENCGYSPQLSSVYTPETCAVTEPYDADTCHVCFHVMPTGSFADCASESGLYDVNGNVWEVVPVPHEVDFRGYQIRGGAFNCGTPSQRFQCTYNAGWTNLYAGFRCCRDRQAE